MPSVMEVGKDNWCCVGTCAKLFSMKCHRNRLCSFLGGGLSQRVCDGLLAPQESNY